MRRAYPCGTEMEGEGEEDNKLDDHTYLAPPQYGRQRGERNFQHGQAESEYAS